jgi:hypothetical protein
MPPKTLLVFGGTQDIVGKKLTDPQNNETTD